MAETDSDVAKRNPILADALIVCCALAALIGLKNGYEWSAAAERLTGFKIITGEPAPDLEEAS
jgi:hypothetical protein